MSYSFLGSLALELNLLPVSSGSLNLVGVLVGLIWITLLNFGGGSLVRVVIGGATGGEGAEWVVRCFFVIIYGDVI